MELSRFEAVVFLKNPLHSSHCCSTSFHSFPVILSWLERSFQELSADTKSIDRGQELIELHLSKVGLVFEFSKACSPRPPREIVAHCHYSPARLTVIACSTSGWIPYYYIRLARNPKYLKHIAHSRACFHLAFPSSFPLSFQGATNIW